jgi:hypothetical protein
MSKPRNTTEPMTPKERVFGTIELVLSHARSGSSDLDLDRAYIIRALERVMTWESELADRQDEPLTQVKE